MADLIKLLQESNAQVNAQRVLITCQEKTTNTLQQQLIDMTKQHDLLRHKMLCSSSRNYLSLVYWIETT